MDIDSNPTLGRLPQQRTGVFISYSHKDKKWLDELNTMLQPLVRMGRIRIWDDTKIPAGGMWRKEIDTALCSASVAVLFVSPEFLASKFIAESELPPLLQAAEREGLTILWVAVKYSRYDLTPIKGYKSVNDPDRPLTTLGSWKRNRELVRICEQIEQAATTPRSKGPAPGRPRSGEPTPGTPMPGGPTPGTPMPGGPTPGTPMPGGPAPGTPRPGGPAPGTPTRADSSASLGRLYSEIQSRLVQDDPLKYLINFDYQRHLFKTMLDDSPEKRLMFIQAPDGRGKTSLLLMLGLHCEQEGIPFCSIDSNEQPYDNPYITLAHAICDQLGHSPRHLAFALQRLSSYSPQGEMDDYTVSQILAGVSVTHDGLRQPDIKERLRDAFIADLGQLVNQKGRAVCLFDNFDRLSSEVEDWLLDALLRPVESGKLKGVVIVTAGRRWPKINKWEWEQSTHLVDGLPRMNAEHIKLYAEKLNIKIDDEEAKIYLKDSAGIPLHMAMVFNLRTLSEVA